MSDKIIRNRLSKLNPKSIKSVSLDSLETLQGNLKKIKHEDLLKLRNSLIRNGIDLPLFLWEHEGTSWLIDGVHRRMALKHLRDNEGYVIESVPLIPVQAKTRKMAMKLVLIATGHNARIHQKGFDEFTKEMTRLNQLMSEVTIAGIRYNLMGEVEASEDDDDLNTTAQFIYTSGEVIDIQAYLDILRDKYQLEDDSDIIIKALQDAKLAI